MIRRATFVTLILTLAVGVCVSQTADWAKFVPPDGSCSILMPGKPELHDISKDNPAGRIVINAWVADTDQGFFVLGITDYPVDIDVQEELDRSRDNFLKEVSAKLMSESDFTLKGYHGKEFTGVSDSHTFKSRLLVVGRRDYMNVVRMPTASLSMERANRFLLSFDLTQNAK